MEFKGLRAGKKKKQRLIKRENTQLVEEPFRCVILGDKMNALSNKFDGRKSQHKVIKQTKVEQEAHASFEGDSRTTAKTELTDDKATEASK